MQLLPVILFLYIVSRPSSILLLGRIFGKAVTPKGIRALQKGQWMLGGSFIAWDLADTYVKADARKFIYAGIIAIDLLVLLRSPEFFEIPIGGYSTSWGPIEKPDDSKPKSERSVSNPVDGPYSED